MFLAGGEKFSPLTCICICICICVGVLSSGRRPCGDADLCYDFTHIEKVSQSRRRVESRKAPGLYFPPPSRPSSDRIPIVHTYSTTSYDIIPLIRYLIYSVQFIVTAHVTACHVYIFWKIYISCEVEDVVAATFFFPKLGMYDNSDCAYYGFYMTSGRIRVPY